MLCGVIIVQDILVLHSTRASLAMNSLITRTNWTVQRNVRKHRSGRQFHLLANVCLFEFFFLFHLNIIWKNVNTIATLKSNSQQYCISFYLSVLHQVLQIPVQRELLIFSDASSIGQGLFFLQCIWFAIDLFSDASRSRTLATVYFIGYWYIFWWKYVKAISLTVFCLKYTWLAINLFSDTSRSRPLLLQCVLACYYVMIVISRIFQCHLSDICEVIHVTCSMCPWTLLVIIAIYFLSQKL